MGKDAFAGKVVVVTGASEGIGRAFCLAIAPAKPKIVAAARNQARLDDLAQEVKRLGAEIVTFSGDLGLREDCKRLIGAAVDQFGAIDVLVNNAGITMWATFEETTDPELIEKVMRTNFYSVAYCTHFALPHLIKSKGRLVGVSSIAGILGVPGHVIYGASKHAVQGFLNSLRVELKPKGVSVTTICPDFVITEIHDRGLKGDGSPMKKRLSPEKYMSAATCAEMMITAIAGRKRDLITSARGRLASKVRDLFPELVDRIAAKQSKRAGLH